jgi:hypothetical protein
MAKRTVSVTSLTPTATADTTALVDATYPFLIRGGSATQQINVIKVQCSGLATVQSPTIMLLGFDSTVGTGTNTNGTGQTDAAMNPNTAALAAPTLTGNSNATTKPQRSATAHLANMSFNAFGGIALWQVSYPGEEIVVYGTAASVGELSLSCFTGGTPGVMGAFAEYETL